MVFFLHWNSYKNSIDHMRMELICRSCEKNRRIPGNNQHNSSIDEQHSSNKILNPHTFRDVVQAAVMSLKHTDDRYSMTNQYPQPSTHQPKTDSYPVFFSLGTMDSKRKELRVIFCILSKKLPTERTSERDSCYGWRVEWSLVTQSSGWNSAVCDEL